jgi:hypothetical protein
MAHMISIKSTLHSSTAGWCDKALFQSKAKGSRTAIRMNLKGKMAVLDCSLSSTHTLVSIFIHVYPKTFNPNKYI